MDAVPTARDPIARHRAAQRQRQRQRGLRQVVLWLPDINDPEYRGRLAEERRQLARATPEEDAAMAGFARLVERTEGWR
jgi:hypothetical protein